MEVGAGGFEKKLYLCSRYVNYDIINIIKTINFVTINENKRSDHQSRLSECT